MNGEVLLQEGRSDPVAGVRIAVTRCGIRSRPGDDLVLVELGAGSRVAATFTRNRFCAAPVEIAKRHLRSGSVRYLLVNAGNANAGTGDQGLTDALRSCQAVASATDGRPETVLPFSTGVIGQRLPVERIEHSMKELVGGLEPDAWPAAARAIMTTDTRPKTVTVRVQGGARAFTLTGIAKGAGMIRPDMATMLAFVATDAPIRDELLAQVLPDLVEASFNSITVDGDTSTNDACVLIATGAETGPELDRDDPDWLVLREGLQTAFDYLAQEIIRDAEGATKFVTIEVSGADSMEDCRELAFTVAHSPLVKTALFASDPNWGRILAAVGRARVAALDIEKVSIWLDDVQIVRNGQPDPHYTEARGQAVMNQDRIRIGIKAGDSPTRARVWTSDLSFDYVKINAEYRT